MTIAEQKQNTPM